ncbi:hypothetical protein Tco_0267835 [Tanacetum coccineum]
MQELFLNECEGYIDFTGYFTDAAGMPKQTTGTLKSVQANGRVDYLADTGGGCGTAAVVDILAHRDVSYGIVENSGMVVSFRGCLGDIRYYRTVEYSAFGLGLERMVLFATGINKMKYGHPKPYQQPQGYVDASSLGSVKAELAAGSWFDYMDSSESVETGPGNVNILSHVTPPKSSHFFADYGMDNGFFSKKALHQESR